MAQAQCQCGSWLQLEPDGAVGVCPQCNEAICCVGKNDDTGLRACLLVEAGPGRVGEQIFPCGLEPINVGKLPENPLSLPGNLVSRHHCTLIPLGDDQWGVEDNASRNGLWVNKEKKQSWQLNDGDVVTIGEYSLRFRSPGTPAATPQPKPQAKAQSTSLSALAPADRRAWIWAVSGVALVLLHGALNTNSSSGFLITTVAPLGLELLVCVLVTGLALLIGEQMGTAFNGFGRTWCKFLAIAFLFTGLSHWASLTVFGIVKAVGGVSILFLSILLMLFIIVTLAISIFWAGLVYLFGFESSDCKVSAPVLGVSYLLSKLIVMFVVGILVGAAFLMNFSNQFAHPPGGGNAPGPAGAFLNMMQNIMDQTVDQAKRDGRLQDARTSSIKTNRPADEAALVTQLYADGAKNVWYETGPQGAQVPIAIVVETPDDSAQRAKCIAAATEWRMRNQPNLPSPVETGAKYFIVPCTPH